MAFNFPKASKEALAKLAPAGRVKGGGKVKSSTTPSLQSHKKAPATKTPLSSAAQAPNIKRPTNPAKPSQTKNQQPPSPSSKPLLDKGNFQDAIAKFKISGECNDGSFKAFLAWAGKHYDISGCRTPSFKAEFERFYNSPTIS